jgi:hypothetical protein
MNIRVIHERVELELCLDRRADIRGLAHFRMPFRNGYDGGSAAYHESTPQSRDGKGDGGSRDIGPPYGRRGSRA